MTNVPLAPLGCLILLRFNFPRISKPTIPISLLFVTAVQCLRPNWNSIWRNDFNFNHSYLSEFCCGFPAQVHLWSFCPLVTVTWTKRSTYYEAYFWFFVYTTEMPRWNSLFNISRECNKELLNILLVLVLPRAPDHSRMTRHGFRGNKLEQRLYRKCFLYWCQRDPISCTLMEINPAVSQNRRILLCSEFRHFNVWIWPSHCWSSGCHATISVCISHTKITE